MIILYTVGRKHKVYTFLALVKSTLGVNCVNEGIIVCFQKYSLFETAARYDLHQAKFPICVHARGTFGTTK